MTTIFNANGLLEIPEVFHETDTLKTGHCMHISHESYDALKGVVRDVE